MEKLLYEGKAKQVYECGEDVIVYYKDDATAFNGKKKSSIASKGILNNSICTIIYEYLNSQGIPTHYIKKLDERSQKCKKVSIIPLEVIVRNIAAGSLVRNLGVEKGTVFAEPLLEFCYKNDELNDPLINDNHIRLLNLCTMEQLDTIYKLSEEINEHLKHLFDKAQITLVDFKLEFGVDNNGDVVLADEISPDTCRLWDMQTGEVFDKDIFRQELGDLRDGYNEVLRRVQNI